jgi:cytochrome P450
MILIYLAQNPEWLEKVRAEVLSAAKKHGSDPNASVVEQLSSLSIEMWESQFPLIDLCLRDSIRLQMPGQGMRRNIGGKDIQLGDVTIPKDAYVAYPWPDLNYDSEVYPDPDRWNPGRYLEERTDSTRPHSYIGWGSGRHPCRK